jgi:MYXO-CTERM domain-containing protein
LTGRLPADDYVLRVFANTTANSAFYSSRPRANGVLVPAGAPVGAVLQRFKEIEFTLEEGAPGVVSTSYTGGGSGCTLSSGPSDAGLLVLLAAALIVLGIRRRKNSDID